MILFFVGNIVVVCQQIKQGGQYEWYTGCKNKTVEGIFPHNKHLKNTITMLPDQRIKKSIIIGK